MKPSGTLDDAVAVFAALNADRVIALLSRLEISEVQQLLATAAKYNPTATELKRANELLVAELSQEPLRDSPEPTSQTVDLDFLNDLPDQDVRTLLSKVNTACWAPALKFEPAAIREIVISNVAPSIANILKQEIEAFSGDPSATQPSRHRIRAVAIELKLVTATDTKAIQKQAG